MCSLRKQDYCDTGKLDNALLSRHDFHDDELTTTFQGVSKCAKRENSGLFQCYSLRMYYRLNRKLSRRSMRELLECTIVLFSTMPLSRTMLETWISDIFLRIKISGLRLDSRRRNSLISCKYCIERLLHTSGNDSPGSSRLILVLICSGS